MSNSVANTSIPMDVLPPFLRDVEIVENAAVEIMNRKKVNAVMKGQEIKSEIKVSQTPILMTSKEVKKAYIQNDFKKIKELEQKAQKDLQPIYENISKNGAKAWTKVRSGGKEFYMSWSNSGCMWVYTSEMKKISSGQNDFSYQVEAQVGTYSKSGSILGLHSYNLSLTSVLVEAVISYIIAKALSQIIAEGLGFLVANFATYICTAAAEMGIEAFSCTVATTALSAVATCLVFAVVFIGLTYLWDWLNRKYTIRLQIFNWDGEHDWKVVQEVRSNAKISGEDKEEVKFSLDRMKNAGEEVLPPGFADIEILDSVCCYGVVVWENDNTFMEGCSMALKVQKGDTQEGFMWAFDCPRFSDNKHAGDNGLQDAAAYLKNCKWKSTPKGFEIAATNSKIPVSFALDALSGAKDNLYNINIHINKKLNQP